MMKSLNRIKAVVALMLGITLCEPAFAQADQNTSREYLEDRIAETLSLIEAYYEEQLNAMIAEAQILLQELDASVAARQQEKREKWAQLADDAQEQANAQLAEMQTALVRFAQQIGTFQSEAERAWKDVLAGVVVVLNETADVLAATLDPIEDQE